MDIFIELGEENPTRSVGQLRTEFFKFHRLKRAERVRKEQAAMNPIALKINPPQYHSDLDDKWFAVYHRHFYVTIEKGDSLFGPHIAKLHIQIYPGYNVWLGTAQLKFNFFSRKETRKKLRLAIVKKKYFCTENSEEEIVELIKPVSTDIDLKI